MFRKHQQSVRAGISIQSDRISIALIKHGKNNQLELVEASNYAVEPDISIEDVLGEANKHLQLRKLPCICVMEPGSYSLLQIESPDVNAEETRSALRWKIKDLIDFHIDDATLDVFSMPPSARAGSLQMMNVVVTRTSAIQQCVNLLHSHDIEPVAIDITELALHNISRLTIAGDGNSTAVMYLLPENVYIEIADSEVLYLSRNIESSLQQLIDAPAPANDANAWHTVDNDSSIYEMLSLEMQRSMDYYESHYGRGPADEMRFFQRLGDDNAFMEFAGRQLPFRIHSDSLHSVIPGIENIDDDVLPNYLPAIGAALRAA